MLCYITVIVLSGVRTEALDPDLKLIDQFLIYLDDFAMKEQFSSRNIENKQGLVLHYV